MSPSYYEYFLFDRPSGVKRELGVSRPFKTRYTNHLLLWDPLINHEVQLG